LRPAGDNLAALGFPGFTNRTSVTFPVAMAEVSLASWLGSRERFGRIDI